MFILETLQGKKMTVIGYAENKEEADHKISIAYSNGFAVTAREIEEVKAVFAERDYSAELMEHIATIVNAKKQIAKLPFGKFSLSEKNAREACCVLLDEDTYDLVINIAKEHNLYLSVGDYGYGRTLEWSTSNGETTGNWVSSSEQC